MNFFGSNLNYKKNAIFFSKDLENQSIPIMVKQKYEMNNPNLKIPLKGLSSNNNIIYYDKKLFYENSRNSTFDNEINQKSLKIKNISGITSRSSREFKLTGIKNKEMDNEENIKKEIDYDIKKTYRKDSKKSKKYILFK